MNKYTNQELIDFIDNELVVAPKVAELLKGEDLEEYKEYVNKFQAIRKIIIFNEFLRG